MTTLRRLLWAGSVAIVLSAAAFAAKTYRAQQRLFFPPRQPVKLSASAAGLSGAADVQIRAHGIDLRGWYVPSRNQAAVILAHGAGANRSALVDEARALSNAGFGVLLLDWPGHGESGGESHWAATERQSLTSALDWLAARPDVSRTRLGAYGFSMGGYVVAQVAATDARLKAVALAGVPADQREQVRYQHGRYWLLAEWPALYALHRGGMKIAERRPIDEVSKISPRALLAIGGTRDPVVPPGAAAALYRAAKQPKQLYEIAGAGHGGYLAVAGAPYLDRLSDFFRQELLKPGD